MSRKNRKKTQKHFYLDRIGASYIKRPDLGDIGFDRRETFSLDMTMSAILYERLCAFREEAEPVVDLTFHHFDVDGEDMTQEQIIIEMTELLEDFLKDDNWLDYEDASRGDEIQARVWKLWSIVLPAMWW